MKKMFLVLILALPLASWARPAFVNITEDEFEDVAKGLASNFTHNSMMGASKLGTIFGFQVGVVGAQTAVPKIDDIAERNGTDLKNLYNAGLMGAVGIPFGLSFEAVVMPTFKADDVKAENTSFAVKLNINEVIPILPVNLALRGFQSNAELSFKQTIASTEATVSNQTTVTGVQLLLSPMLPIVEPYVGVGYLNAENELEVSNTTGTVFGYTTAQKDKETISGTQFLVGAEVSLLLIKLGAEYSQAFGNSRYGVKLAIGF
ncbi:MAG: DUF6588 family protein [Bdellovibrionales bacterium]